MYEKVNTSPDFRDVEDQTKQRGSIWCSSRFGLAILCFFGTVNLYALRVNLSVALVCMVNHTALYLDNHDSPQQVPFLNDSRPFTPIPMSLMNSTNTSAVTFNKCGSGAANFKLRKKEDGSFTWSKSEQGLILSAFFYGYMVTQISGGIMAERFGGKRLFGGVMAVCAVATLLSPLAAKLHHAALVTLRVIIGLCQGVVFPCLHAVWSQWAPPLERTILTSFSYAGNQMGNVITFPLAGFLCDALGWESVFYFFGSFTIIWCAFWFWLASSTPQEHKRISKEELLYIKTSQRGQINHDRAKKAVRTPWLKMLTSMPVWAIIVANTTSNFGVYLVLTNLPTFMREVLNFDIKSNGALSAIPYIMYFIGINIAGVTSDFLRRRRILSTTNVRKLMMLFALGGQAVFLIATGYCECGQETLAVVFITLAQGISGLQYGGFIVNHVDIAPRYAGTLFGISNTMGTVSGIVVPPVAAALTSSPSREAWRTVFWVAGCVLLFGAVFYAIFGSGELQSWAVPVQPSQVQLLPLNHSVVSQLTNPHNTSLLDQSDSKEKPDDSKLVSFTVTKYTD